MTRPTVRTRRAALAAAIAGLALALGVQAAAPPRSPLDGWTRISLEGRKFLVASGRSEITRFGVTCAGDRELLVVHSEARLFGARAGEHYAASLLHSGGAGVDQWMELSPLKKARRGRVIDDVPEYRLVSFRAGDDGGEPGAGGWTETSSTSWPLATSERPKATGHAALGPIDPYGLIGRLALLVERREGEIVLLTKNGPATLAFRTAARETVSVRYRDEETGSRQRQEIEAAVIEVVPKETDGGETLLAMSGPTRLWIDPQNGALLQIRGYHDEGRGEITLRLDSLSRRAPESIALRWPGVDAGPCRERDHTALDAARSGS